jgi:thioredoxin reductase (NADPH)
MSQEISADVAIVGSGPVGLFAVFECGMLKLSSVLIDALGEVGGQCTAFNPERPIYDVPAHQAIAAGDLVSRLEEKSAPFKPARLLGRRVERLSGAPGDFRPVSATNGMSAYRPTLPDTGSSANPPVPPLQGRTRADRAIGFAPFPVVQARVGPLKSGRS